MSDAQLQALLTRLQHQPLPTIDFTLERMVDFLAMIGNPHMHVAPIIHVAGTNGKGSVLAFLRAMLQARGMGVHRYTSPHLVRFHERYLVAGREVSTAMLLEVLHELMPHIERCPMTYFESTTALAFMLFSRVPADVVLLEVGMGGRLDATNVHPHPLATVITPVGMDHCAFLGDSLASIAAEKAAIMKPGVPCIVTRQEPQAMAVICEMAANIGAPLYCEGEAWTYEPCAGGFVYISDEGRRQMPVPSLLGAHQYGNAAAAIACMEVLTRGGASVRATKPALHDGAPDARMKGRPSSDDVRERAHMLEVPYGDDMRVGEGAAPDDVETLQGGEEQASALWEAVAHGVAHAYWPGRLQRVPDHALPTHHTVVVDGAHNPPAARQLAAWMQAQSVAVHLVVAMHKDKEADAIMRILSPHVASICVVGLVDDPSMMDAQALTALAQTYYPTARQYDTWRAALDALTVTKAQKDVILIAGSLYLVGDVLKQVEESE